MWHRQSGKRPFFKKTAAVSILGSILGFFLTGVLVLSNLVGIGYAATVSGHGVEGLTATTSSSDVSASSPSAGSINASVTGTAKSGCTAAASKSGNLTLQNTKSVEAELSFSYTPSVNGGTVTVDGTSRTAAGTFSKTLASNGSVVISLTSAVGASTTSISLTGIQLIADTTATTTFAIPENGSYTIKLGDTGETTTLTSSSPSAVSFTKSSSVSYTLTATAASGYRFFGWYKNTTSLVSQTSPTTLNNESNCTIAPRFIPSTAPVFLVGSNYHFDLPSALGDSSNSKIVLVGNGTLAAGNYTIPNGKTLLIPFDDAHTCYTDTPDVVYGSHATPTAFKTLTMAPNAKISVSNGGKISVSSKLCATGTGSGSWNGCPTGPGGRIVTSEGSSITLDSGAGLYCYGYISGSGSVTAKSGSTVYEALQFRCWRGGSATSGMTSGVFPMNQYYVQNIETKLTLQAGATEKVYTSVNMSSRAYPTSTTFIGSNAGLFRLTSGSLVKEYHGSTDRMSFRLNGTASIQELSVSLTITVKTSNYQNMPITNNIDLVIASGGAVTVNENIALLPSSCLTIESGASVTINSGKKIFVYDKDEWYGKYYAAPSCDIVPVGYSTVNGTTAKRNTNGSDLVDAKVDINGSLTVNGGFYTTAGGANVTSSEGTGKITYGTAATSSMPTHQQATQSGTSITKETISTTYAKLRNGSQFGTKEYEVNECDSSGTPTGEKETITVTSYTATANAPAGREFSFNCVEEGQEENYAEYGFWWHKHFGAYVEPPKHCTINFHFANETVTTIDYDLNDKQTIAFPSGPKKWRLSDNTFLISGNYNMPTSHAFIDALAENQIYDFYVFNGGWFGEYYYDLTDCETVSGIYQIEVGATLTQTTVYAGDYCRFDSDGKFAYGTDVYHNSADSKDYFIHKGIIEFGFGLFKIDYPLESVSYFYYNLLDGTIVKNAYFYVEKTNGYTVGGIDVLPGLYRFDSQGRMWYGNEILTDQTNFELITGDIEGGPTL